MSPVRYLILPGFRVRIQKYMGFSVSAGRIVSVAGLSPFEMK